MVHLVFRGVIHGVENGLFCLPGIVVVVTVKYIDFSIFYFCIIVIASASSGVVIFWTRIFGYLDWIDWVT